MLACTVLQTRGAGFSRTDQTCIWAEQTRSSARSIARFHFGPIQLPGLALVTFQPICGLNVLDRVLVCSFVITLHSLRLLTTPAFNSTTSILLSTLFWAQLCF